MLVLTLWLMLIVPAADPFREAMMYVHHSVCVTEVATHSW
jgi:hypothetical protein